MIRFSFSVDAQIPDSDADVFAKIESLKNSAQQCVESFYGKGNATAELTGIDPPVDENGYWH
jgi:hypothetical protein